MSAEWTELLLLLRVCVLLEVWTADILIMEIRLTPKALLLNRPILPCPNNFSFLLLLVNGEREERLNLY